MEFSGKPNKKIEPGQLLIISVLAFNTNVCITKTVAIQAELFPVDFSGDSGMFGDYTGQHKKEQSNPILYNKVI
jgi:hypothetical protein